MSIDVLLLLNVYMMYPSLCTYEYMWEVDISSSWQRRTEMNDAQKSDAAAGCTKSIQTVQQASRPGSLQSADA